MNGLNVVEEEVEVAAAGGVADAVLYRPAAGLNPGVIHFPDGIGTRPSMRQMARRLAAEGYAVLLPNIYYRTARAPFFPPRPDFGEEATRARFAELTGALSPETMERDGSAYVDYLGSRKDVRDGPVGVVGYCFTGAFALRCAAARPDRVAATASFHGGGLFKEGPGSPHLVLPRVKSRLYFGHARDDRGMPAAAIVGLEEALVAWGGRYESETYDALHGWTVPDSAAYDEAEAERAYAKLGALLGGTLRANDA